MGLLTDALLSLLPDNEMPSVGVAHYRRIAREFFGALEDLIRVSGLPPEPEVVLTLVHSPEILEGFIASAPRTREWDAFNTVVGQYRDPVSAKIDPTRFKTVVGSVAVRLALEIGATA